MYGYDLLTNHEYQMACIFDDFKDEAICFLEEQGTIGRLYLVALTNNKTMFEDLYRDYECNSVSSEDY